MKPFLQWNEYDYMLALLALSVIITVLDFVLSSIIKKKK